MASLYCAPTSCLPLLRSNPKQQQQQIQALSMKCINSSSLTLHSNPNTCLRSLTSSTNLFHNAIPLGGFFMKGNEKSHRSSSIVCEASPRRKPDSAEKRARQAEKRRLYNKAKKSEIKTRMKKVFEALDMLKKKSDAEASEILPIEKLIAEAFSAIDKAVKSGTLHRNTGARRKSRLSRTKKSVEIQRGWYTPPPAATA